MRTGDKGVDKHGQRKGNFEPGVDLRAKVTILAEGARGSLTKAADGEARPRPGAQPAGLLDRRQGALGGPGRTAQKGAVIHTMG